MKRSGIGILIAGFFMLCSSSLQADTADELFFKANQAYKTGSYKDAERMYSQLTESGNVSGHVFYNLGNAYFKTGDLGRAVLNYERAQMIIPRDEDLRFNLRYAKDRTRDAVEVPRPLGAFFFWLDVFNLTELFLAFALCNALFFSSLMLRLVNRREWTFILTASVLLLWLASGISFGVRWYQEEVDSRAVILAGEVKVLAGPDEKESELFQLHAGTVVRKEKTEGDWDLIAISEEKRGWVRRGMMGYLSFASGTMMNPRGM